MEICIENIYFTRGKDELTAAILCDYFDERISRELDVNVHDFVMRDIRGLFR
jgi:hypothetical protein